MRIVILLLMAVAFCGCDAQEEIVAYKAPKEQRPAAPAPPPPPQSAPQSADEVGVHWTLPAGWVQQPPRNMVVVSFKTSDQPTAADIIVTKFPSHVMNDQLANINRYRNMVGLEPLKDASEQPVEDIKVDGQPAKRYQFDGKEKKLTIIAIPRGEVAWFVRFLGPIAEIDREKTKFDSFVQSLHW